MEEDEKIMTNQLTPKIELTLKGSTSKKSPEALSSSSVVLVQIAIFYENYYGNWFSKFS